MLRLLILCFFAATGASAQTLRVDPPHWWVGTSVTRLELLVSSDSALSSVTVRAPGVVLVSDVPAANPRYRYVTVEVKPNAKPAKVALVA